MTFAEKLRQLRESKGWSQGELAEQSGTAQQSIANWETGERVPAFDAVQALCTALGVPCTAFDGCEHSKIENKRGRGRPPKADAAPSPNDAKPTNAKAKNKKGKGA